MSIRTDVGKFPLVVVSRKIKKANALLSRKLQWRAYVAVLILSDAVMTYLSFELASFFRFELLAPYFDASRTVPLRDYKVLPVLMSILWLVIFALNGLYTKGNLLGGTREYSKVFRSSTEGFLVIVVAGFLDTELVFARGWLLMAWALTFLLN